MPTILKYRSFRFYFYSHENNEPPHIHIDKDDKSAKFWINPINLAVNYGFNKKELNEIEKLIKSNKILMLEKWSEFFYGK
jgi:hypothetical protein